MSQELAASVGKSRWADKTPGNELFAKDILELFPGSRILSVLRDHRDVITSKREKERGSDDPAAFSWIKSRRGDYFWRPSIEAHFWNLTHLPRERYATLLYEDLSRMIVEKGGRTFYNPASATSPYPRGGRSNTSAHRDSLAQYEISARSVASYAKRFGRIELMIARRVFGNGDGVAITSWKAFGIRERRYAWKPTRKAKFGCRQIGRRLGD